MPWIFGLVGLLVGAILGIIISRIKTPQYKKHKQLQKDLDTAKFELEQQRQELTDHFAHMAEMLDTLGKDYNRLYQYMENTATEMLPGLPEQDKPFAKNRSQPPKEPELPEVSELPPKDYAKGATGLLKEEPKEVIQTEDTEKTSSS